MAAMHTPSMGNSVKVGTRETNSGVQINIMCDVHVFGVQPKLIIGYG
jgi:hypothetical protein